MKEAIWQAVECDAIDVVLAILSQRPQPPSAILNEFRDINEQFGDEAAAGGGDEARRGGGRMKTGLAHVAARRGCVPMVTGCDHDRDGGCS